MPSITLKSALKDLEEALDETTQSEEVTGALAVLAALIRHDVKSFDGEPIYMNNILIGIHME
jgi:glucose-6-phosphate isomerase